MTALLVTATIAEIVLVAAVLVYYLLRIAASLRRTAAVLAKVSFGVRAIETQCGVLGPSLLRINGQLQGVASALDGLAELADARSGGQARAGQA